MQNVAGQIVNIEENVIRCTAIRTDCKTIRLITEIINVASKRSSHIKSFLEFDAGILNNRMNAEKLPTVFRLWFIARIEGE